MTGNGLLTRYVGESVSRCSLILARFSRPHSSDCAVSEHVQLIDALERGCADEARRLMDHHIGAVQERALIERIPHGGRKLHSVLDGYARQVLNEGAP